MLRKLPLAMAIALAVTPLQSHALGLGNIKTNSVLNQPFDAEIQLLSVPPGELDGVRVKLASSEAFARAEIDRPFLLTKLKFNTERKQNGDAVVKVSSGGQLIQEPFLNFLLEVDWPKGRMVREFTVLLDPPMTTGRKAAPVAAPAASSSRTTTPTSTRTAAARTSGSSYSAGPGEYGPVQRNETLWGIADAHRSSDVSVNQMMLALLEANPQAFSADNINTLKAGTILRIPSAEEAAALSKAQAAQIANRQYQDWKQGLTQSSSAPVPAPAPEKEAEPAMQDTPVEEAAAPATSEDAALLKLSGSEVATGTGSGDDTDSDAIKQELITAQEKVVSTQGEAEELRSRMLVMEQQLADMKRLLELKDEQLTKLQSANADMASGTEAEQMEAPVEVEETVEMTESAMSEAAEEVTAETMPDETMPQEEMVEPAAEEVMPEPAAMSPEPMAEEPAMQEEKPTGIIELLTGSATMMGIAIAVLVVLLALIWAAFSRRKSNQDAETLQDVVAKEAPAVAVTPDTEPAPTAEPVPDEHPDDETSFLSEFTPGDLSSLQDDETGEVDPISEADVYIAYGRFDQAEDLVKQALEADPGNVLYEHKLLEIYYANKDQEKFTALANQMHEDGAEESNPDAWNRAKLMGIDLDPENPLFADAMDTPSVDITDDLDMALSELESQLTGTETLDDMDATEEPLDELDLGEIAGSQGSVPEKVGAAEDEILPLPDVDLDSSASAIQDDDTAIEELAAELEAFDLGTADTSDIKMDAPDLEPQTDEDLLLSGEDDSLDDLASELDEVDDVTTKIDLARAYIEMGDKEGAKGILEEVLDEGSEAQKQQAEALIAEIS